MKSKSVHDPMQTIATMLGYGVKSFERTRMSTDACDPNYRLRVAAFDGLCHLTEEGMTSNAPTALQLAGPPRRFFVMTEEEALWLHGALGEVLEEHAAHEAKEKELPIAVTEEYDRKDREDYTEQEWEDEGFRRDWDYTASYRLVPADPSPADPVQWAAVQMALLLLESLRTSWEYIRGYRDGLCELREGMHELFGGSLEREP